MTDSSPDLLLVGGGLQAGLIALAVLHERPGTRITILERDARLGGNHTWSFHSGDVAQQDEGWIAPLRQWSWGSYDVFFPELTRTLESGYTSFDGEHLHAVVSERMAQAPGCAILLGTPVTAVDARGATAGARIEASLVVDCRGPERAPIQLDYAGGYQKFVGLELELDAPHGLSRPTLMDATVDQHDGFRFVYVLPFTDTRVLVEDTYFSNTPDLDVATLRQRVGTYIGAKGWSIARELRQEQGVLPMPSREVALGPGPPLVGGYAGGWFHPGTGYSFPVAARLASFIASRPVDEVLGADLRALVGQIQDQQRYGLLLNEMVFEHGDPATRWHAFQRFYGLSEATISRFYALRTTRADRLRSVVGLPPRGVSVPRAVGSLVRYVRERHSA